MANIATCPKCAKQLGLPATIEATDRAECPECRAIFSLSETVQISLPVVRILEPAVQPATATIAATDEQKESATDTLASNTEPLKSWEERLKNALALDGSDDVATAASDASETPVTPIATKATPSRSPSFDFELDPNPPAEAKSKPAILDRELPKAQPLATLAASPKSPKPQSRTTSAAAPKPTTKEASTPPKTLADFATAELASATLVPASGVAANTLAELPKQVEKVKVAVQAVARRPIARSRLPKIAAFAAGPVLGGLLGLYGLLWLQGSQADFVGLSRVLPASLLPVDFGMPTDDEASGAVLLADTSSPNSIDNLREPPMAIKRDEAVKPASAAQPLPPVLPGVRIKLDEFHALVDAAEAALPEFVVGDLATPGTIKRKGQAYMALCRLAEHFDFAQQPGLAPSVQAKARQAMQLYHRTARQANVRHDLAHIAGRWWEYDKRPSPGIFLAGEVQEAEPAGAGTLCWVKLGRESTVPAIPVWFLQGRYQTGDQIGVVGSVISSPGDFPQGFSGRQVVAAKYGFAL